MPNIIIKENYVESPTQLSVTDNTVLVPILVGADSGLSMKLYTTYKTFTEDYSAKKITFEDGAIDRSYIFAAELLRLGLYIVALPVEFTGNTYAGAVTAINTEMAKSDIIEAVSTKNLFDIKFITTGGYPNILFKASGSDYTLDTCCYASLLKMAANRTDGIALLELPEDFDNTNNTTFLKKLTDCFPSQVANGEYGACFYPHINVNLINYGDYGQATSWMPATFGYLAAFANMVRTNAPWFSAAGVIRGVIPNLIETKFEVTEAQKTALQYTTADGDQTLFICVNPIMNIHGYGHVIYGNRTFAAPLKVDGLSFKNFLNVRCLLSIIKKQIYQVSTRLTFEPNDDLIWLSFKAYNNDLLDRMKSGRGISSYVWRKEKAEDKATLKASLTIRPIEAIENFDITITLTDDTATVEEG